jgi:DNA-binding NtrC family response regulator
MDSEQSQAPRGRVRVLIVESEPLLRWSMLETLKEGAYDARAVADARSGVMAAAERDYDIVVVAEDLPDFEGLTLLPALRQLSPGACVVMTATHASRDLVAAAFAHGAVKVIEKPFAMDTLADRLAQALRGDSRAA